MPFCKIPHQDRVYMANTEHNLFLTVESQVTQLEPVITQAKRLVGSFEIKARNTILGEYVEHIKDDFAI